MTTRIQPLAIPTPTGRRGSTPAKLWSALRAAMALGRQRIALDQLDEHLLDDIGVSRDDARHEAQRPVWDVPENWRQ